MYNVQFTLIALKSNGSNWSSDFFSAVGQFFLIIIACAVVLFLAYFCTKWMATSAYRGKGRHIKLIEGLGLGLQNSVQIIKVDKKYYLLGVSKDKVTFLTQLDDLELNEEDTANNTNPFEKILSQVLQKNRK